MDTLSHFCVVSAGGERFGIAASRVEEVIERPAVLPLPLMPAPLVGVVRWREQVLPLINPKPHAEWQRAVVVRTGGELVAIAVDTVEEGLHAKNGFAAMDVDQLATHLRATLAEAFRSNRA